MKALMVTTLGLVLTSLAMPALAQASKDSCPGKALTLVVGSPPAGGYDSYGRLVARHFGQFVPGHCAVVVQNMPGAGSLVAANYLFHQASEDGTTIGMIQPNLILNQAFKEKNVKYDLRKFQWIGRIDTSVETTVVWRPSPVNTIEDAKVHPITLGAASAGGTSAGFPRVMNAVLGTKFKIIPGYGGMAGIALALERGEVQGGHMTGSKLLGDKHDWLTGHKVSVLVQYSQTRDPDFASVPTMVELARSPEQKKILSLFASMTDIGRTIIAPPGVAKERVAALRSAFASMVKSPEFGADAKKLKMDVRFMSGEALAKLVDSGLDISPALAEEAKRAWTGKK